MNDGALKSMDLFAAIASASEQQKAEENNQEKTVEQESLFSRMERELIISFMKNQALLLQAQEAGLRPLFFQDEKNKAILEIIFDFQDMNMQYNPLLVSSKYADLYGENILSEITEWIKDGYALGSGVAFICGKLKEQYKLVTCTQILKRTIASIQIDGLSAVDKAMKDIADLHASQTNDDQSVSDACIEFVDDLEKLQNLKDGELAGVDSGFNFINEEDGGFIGPDLIIVGARPGVGKTTLGIHSLIAAAKSFLITARMKHPEIRERFASDAEFDLFLSKNPIESIGRHAGMISTEMRNSQLAARMVCNQGLLPYGKTRRGRLEDHEWQKVTDGMSIVHGLPIRLLDKPSVYIDDIKAIARMWKVKYGLSFLVVDYIQNLKHKMPNLPRSVQVGDNIKELKSLALELNIPVVVLTQVKRLEGKNERPTVDDLKESGDIEQAADVIYLLHRDEINNPDGDQKGIMEIIRGKARFGELKINKVKYIGAYQRFEDIDYNHINQVQFG